MLIFFLTQILLACNTVNETNSPSTDPDAEVVAVDYGCYWRDEAWDGFAYIEAVTKPQSGLDSSGREMQLRVSALGTYKGVEISEDFQVLQHGALEGADALHAWVLGLRPDSIYAPGSGLTTLSCWRADGGISLWPLRFDLLDSDGAVLDCAYASIAPTDAMEVSGCHEVPFGGAYDEDFGFVKPDTGG